MEYYWYFDARPEGWLKMPAGRYPASLAHSIVLNGFHENVFIYDEYENLLYVVSGEDALDTFRRIGRLLYYRWHAVNRKNMKFHKGLNLSWYIVDKMLENMPNQETHEKALELFERLFVEKGKRLRGQ